MSKSANTSFSAKTYDIATICHAANGALRVVLGESPSPNWIDLDSESKLSVIEGVQHALSGKTSEELHESWCRYKEDHGWKYGPVQNAEAKTHPNLVAYDQLPESQKLKDALFKAIVEVFKCP